MKAISYALFNYGKKTPDNCFEFNSYLRGLMVNIRVNRIIYPGWVNVLNLDKSTYESPYKPLFNWLIDKGLLQINICESAPLTLAMLWRLQPVFFTGSKWDEWKFTHVLCRDIDSVCTYREAQMVQEWVNEDKTIHCITDSISHNIPMMGGMVGFRPAHLSMRMQANTWGDLIAKGGNSYNWNKKGSDQEFMNDIIYHKCADSATEHFIKGMRHNLPEVDGRHYRVPDIDIGVDPLFKELNHVCGHVGSAGYYEIQMVKFLCEIDPYRGEYKDIEKKFPQIFYWNG